MFLFPRLLLYLKMLCSNASNKKVHSLFSTCFFIFLSAVLLAVWLVRRLHIKYTEISMTRAVQFVTYFKCNYCAQSMKSALEDCSDEVFVKVDR